MALSCLACERKVNPPTSPFDPADSGVRARGEYLAQAGNCGACHKGPDGHAMAGGQAFQTPFGRLYAANITPDPETGIGNWTLDQFRQALRKGVRPDGAHLYPVFPYSAFTKLTDEDIAALYAYLRQVAPFRFRPPASEMSFPFSQRWLLGIWNAMFLDEGPFKPDAGQSAEWNRGAYLVNGLAHCSACHSPRNSLGAEKSSAWMSGGILVDEVLPGQLRTWSAPNLTSGPGGLSAWSTEEIQSYLKSGANSFITSFGPMNEVIQGTSRLSDPDLHAMAVYLKSLPARGEAHSASGSKEVLENGQAVYDVNCGICHQPDGKGAADSGPALAGSLIVQSTDPASLINNILYGPKMPEPAPRQRGWRKMQPFYDDIGDDDIADLATYLRSAWGNSAAPVTGEQVAKQR
jgi:mono/diheme cytochrome c family protein